MVDTAVEAASEVVTISAEGVDISEEETGEEKCVEEGEGMVNSEEVGEEETSEETIAILTLEAAMETAVAAVEVALVEVVRVSTSIMETLTTNAAAGEALARTRASNHSVETLEEEEA